MKAGRPTELSGDDRQSSGALQGISLSGSGRRFGRAWAGHVAVRLRTDAAKRFKKTANRPR